MLKITPKKIKTNLVTIPGSKSYTHRFLIISALSNGVCVIANPLKSEDTFLTLSALKNLGINIAEDNNKIIINGTSGKIYAPSSPIYLKGSGTSIRLLTAVCCLGKGKFTLAGNKALSSRPINDLISALTQIEVLINCPDKQGFPPLEIIGNKNIAGGKVNIKAGKSSQYLSALLMIAPYTKKGLDITVTDEPVSKPYIDITIEAMKQAGVKIERDGYKKFVIKGEQTYKNGTYNIEPDASAAGYFWAAAAITKSSVTVKNLNKESKQGDINFPKILEQMGCKIKYTNNGITVTGANLTGIQADMSDMPDMVPTLAIVAAFAKGETIIKNVGHLKIKESDRLTAMETELNKIGIKAKAFEDKLIIKGGKPKGAAITTYDDHRIAMSFAIAGLKTDGIIITDEKCVDKSFPDFWKTFERL
ncbi:MAG: 3-phosphoshikimate 1-carboxyvinyltransferase [Deltaproteobacteria bacterium]|nr:3-phosphoshikimate 1-carboxyvinyltransferase [Deltaproteobacteria bacterium]